MIFQAKPAPAAAAAPAPTKETAAPAAEEKKEASHSSLWICSTGLSALGKKSISWINIQSLD